MANAIRLGKFKKMLSQSDGAQLLLAVDMDLDPSARKAAAALKIFWPGTPFPTDANGRPVPPLPCMVLELEDGSGVDVTRGGIWESSLGVHIMVECESPTAAADFEPFIETLLGAVDDLTETILVHYAEYDLDVDRISAPMMELREGQSMVDYFICKLLVECH